MSIPSTQQTESIKKKLGRPRVHPEGYSYYTKKEKKDYSNNGRVKGHTLRKYVFKWHAVGDEPERVETYDTFEDMGNKLGMNKRFCRGWKDNGWVLTDRQKKTHREFAESVENIYSHEIINIKEQELQFIEQQKDLLSASK